MSTWSKEKLERLIADKVEESLTLEYKSALSLGKQSAERDEITKDVSALANASGGVLIYGIAEPREREKRHAPERLDPIVRTDFSKEWLEQVIQTIQPKIEGVVIHPVTIDNTQNKVCYVIEIPQSHTAHQATDYRYYKRHNFNVQPMEDYEVRDVMNRRSHPRLRAWLFFNKKGGLVLAKLENIGKVMAREFLVQLSLPVHMGGFYRIEDPKVMDTTDEGSFYAVRLRPNFPYAPLFPDSEFTIRRAIETEGYALIDAADAPLRSGRQIKAAVFADEMPVIKATLEIEPVMAGWTLIGESGK